jgi:hypothetical protein
MASISPFVRHMLICDDARESPSDPRTINIYGLISQVRPTTNPPVYPLTVSFGVYLALTDGRGTGQGQIIVLNSDSGRIVYTGQSHQISFGSDPLMVHGVLFRISSCSFPESGLYWVEFRYNSQMIAREPLLVR